MHIEKFFAKSPLSEDRQITNKEHLSSVAELAKKFGRGCGLSDEAYVCGILHDFGKYSERFQGVLLGTYRGIDHAFCSAAILYSSVRKRPVTYGPIVETINGHHDGLVSWTSLSGLFEENLKNNRAITCPSGKEAALAGRQYEGAWAAFQNDFPDFSLPALPKRTRENNVEDMLDTRMLFSCLVDADYSASAQNDDPDYLIKSSGAPLDAPTLLESLSLYRASLRASSTSDPKLNAIRDKVFEDCGAAGKYPVGLFTLTAPTGVGKTMALLHFALRHCIHNLLQRIIIVLPFLTLAEQSEKEYAKIVPDILVDHSQKDLPEEAREMAARWDAPMVITTSVRFFEGLFSNKPTECRKLHALAGSVVIFDEAQSLPAKLAPATIQAINRLCQRYNCSMVFSTATQPDFAALPGAVWKPTELVPDYAELYDRLRRTSVDWRLSSKTPLEQIAWEMAEQQSVCVIVNLRRHAAKIYKLLAESGFTDGLFYLTTDLCPAHRLITVETIKQRLRSGLPCCVVATQCIEAGVDLDFAMMYRALAPLEAIIQAAGRCNRNGKCPDGGRLIVFEPDEIGRLYPSDWYEHASVIVKTMFVRNGGTLDINDPAVINAYYKELFCDADGQKDLQDAIDAKAYGDVHEKYRLIDKQGVKVIVPWKGNLELFSTVREEALQSGVTAALMRRAAHLTVSTFDRDAVEQHAERLSYARKKGGKTIKSDVYVLNKGHEFCYNEKIGLSFSELPANNYFL